MLRPSQPSLARESGAENGPAETPLASPQDCLHKRFERCVQTRPTAIALVHQERTLTYAELNELAEKIAARLQSLGIGPEQRVGVLLGRGIDLIAAILGVLKAGAAYVPLDPNYPAARIQFMVEDAELAALISNESASTSHDWSVPAIVNLDSTEAVHSNQSLQDASAQANSPAVAERAPADSAAYVIYTSGSTGQPKGVVVEHRAVCNLVASQQRSLEIGTSDRILQLASASFDVSVWEIFTALTSGAALCLPSAEQAQPGPALIDTLQQMRITIAAFPASLLAALPPSSLPELRTIVVGGERCTADLAARWAPGRRFVNHYGPTEATVCATMHVCGSDEQGDPPIGRPLDNVRVFLLDEHQRLVAAGEVGEVYLAGEGLARGYWNRPSLTSQRFLVGLLPDQPDTRLYRTGDSARYREDGELEFVSRLDDQVKLRGFRIELGEIEAAIAKHEEINQVAVVVREDAPGVKRLVAYLKASRLPNPSALREYLEAQLPAHMVPSAFVAVDAFPLNANGKLDRSQLPAPTASANSSYAAAPVDIESGLKNEPPQGCGLESQLREIWCDVLGLEEIGLDEHFVELGGDSLLSVEIASKAVETGIRLEPNDVLAHPTIARLASFAQSR